MCLSTRLTLLTLGLAVTAGSATPVFEWPPGSGVLRRWGGFGEMSLQTVPIGEDDRGVMANVYHRLGPEAEGLSIYSQINTGACHYSSQHTVELIANELPAGWRVDQMWSQDFGATLGGTGHAVSMVTSPNGGRYLIDLYSGKVEMAAMITYGPETGRVTIHPDEFSGLTAFSAVFVAGNWSYDFKYAATGNHAVRNADGSITWIQYDANGGILKQETFPGPGGPSSQQPPPDDPGVVRLQPETVQRLLALQSWDPNELLGPAGVGDAGYVPPGQRLDYAVLFENMDTATAPAAEVVVTDTVDPAFADLESFELGAITFGSTTVTPPSGAQSYDTVVDLRPGQALLLQIHADLDAATGVVTWRFTSVDPETGEVPADPLLGFLPPNTTPPQGEGRVSYSLLPKAGLATGAVFRHAARIVFDANAAIDTNTWVNTIDAGAPSSRVLSLPASPTGDFTVRWEGADDGQGSGIAHYTVYAAKDDGAFGPWLEKTDASSSTFRGEHGRTYRFYCEATDRVGNREGRVAEAPPIDASSVTGGPLALAAGLHFLGLPVLPDQTDALALFGFTNNRWAKWLPATSSFARYPAPEAAIQGNDAGQAFWVELDEARTITVPGRLADRRAAVSIALEPGWNAVSSPYLTPMPWSVSAIKVVYGTEERSLAEAAAAGWVSDYAWAWQPQLGAYVVVYDPALLSGAAAQWEPWRGYWLKATVPCRLVLPVPTGEVSSRRAAAPQGWLGSLRVEAGAATQQVYFGVSRSRAVQVARPPAPPTAGKPLEVALVRDGEPLAVDVQRSAAGLAWDLAITTPVDQEVTVSWPSLLRQVPTGLLVELTDPVTGGTTLLNTRATWRGRATAGLTRRLRLTVRRGSIERAEIIALTATPTRGRGLSMTLTLSGPGELGLVVRGPNGRLVKRVVSQSATAGQVTLAWDGTDDSGRPVPPGSYLLEATALSPNGALSRATRVVTVR